MSIRFDARAVLAVASCVAALAFAASGLGVPGMRFEGPSHASAPLEGAEQLTVLRADGPSGSPVRMHGGVPLPQEIGITDTDELVLVRRAETARGAPTWEEVPAEWNVASRWQGRRTDVARPIRWVHVTAFARGAETLTVKRVRPRSAERETGTPEPQLAVVDEAGICIDTGAMRFRVRRDRFALFDHFELQASAQGAALVGPLAGGEDVVLDYALLSAAGEVEERTTRLSRRAPDSVVLESAGPLRACVVVRGAIAATGRDGLDLGLRYALRVETWKGAGDLRVEFSIVNASAATPLDARCIRFEIPTTLREHVEAVADGNVLQDVRSLRLLQRHDVVSRIDESRNFSFELTGDGVGVARGERSQGLLELATSTAAITVHVPDFWKRWPAALSFAHGLVVHEFLPAAALQRWPPDLGDLPAELGDVHRIDAGRSVTWTTHLRTRSGGGAAGAGRSLSALAARPPGLDAEWVARSKAAGSLAPAEFATDDADLQTLVRRHARMQRSLVDADVGMAQGPGGVVPPVSLQTQRESRASSDPANRYDADLYGWVDYGDLIDGGGYRSGESDWLHGLLLGYLRHGTPSFLDEALAVARHRVDVDQLAIVDGTGVPVAAFARSDAGRHGRWSSRAGLGVAVSSPARVTRLRGLLLAHAITAEPRALEVAWANANAFIAYADGQVADIGTRLDLDSWATAVQELLAFYDHTGVEAARDSALRLFEHRIVPAEELFGEAGDSRSGGANAPGVRTAALVAALETSVCVHEHGSDPRALSLALRLVRRLRQTLVAGTGRLSSEGYLPLQLHLLPADERTSAHAPTSIQLTERLTDPITYVAERCADLELQALAWQLFVDSVLFRDAQPGTAVQRGAHSVASLVPRAHAGDEVATQASTLVSHARLLGSAFAAGRSASIAQRPSNQVLRGALLAADRADGAYVARVTGIAGVTPSAALRVSVTELTLKGDDLVFRIHSSTQTRVTGELLDPVTHQTVMDGCVIPMPDPHVVRHEIRFIGVAPLTDYDVRIMARDVDDRVCVVGPIPVRLSADGSVDGLMERAESGVDPGTDAEFTSIGRVPRSAPAGRPVGERVLLDDPRAQMTGPWTRVDALGAVGGGQALALDPDVPASMTFEHTPTVDRTYRLFLRWEAFKGAATQTRVEIEDADGVMWVRVDQAAVHSRWRLLGRVRGTTDAPVRVRVSNLDARGAVALDALRLDEVLER